MSLSIEEVMSEAGDEQARAFVDYLEEKETDFSFETLAAHGNTAIAAFVEGFHSYFIPWVARAIAEQRLKDEAPLSSESGPTDDRGPGDDQ
jgi:hypothetical protein